MQLGDGTRHIVFEDESNGKQEEEEKEVVEGRNRNGTREGNFTPNHDKAKRVQLARRLVEDRKKLPIWPTRHVLAERIMSNKVTIVLGETGSGKSTQIPQFLASKLASGKKIGITQPRRISAVSLASRVAQEEASIVGASVGYSIRFDDRTQKNTRIKYITDGMLLREMLADHELRSYEVVIIDEAHERSLLTDMILGFMKALVQKRDDLHVIVMSATIDADRFSRFFWNAEICFVEGRQYPVTIYNDVIAEQDVIDAALRVIFQIHLKEDKGDVLVFLPGQDAIESLESLITQYAAQLPKDDMQIQTCPLYAALPQSAQRQVFHPAPGNSRKIILATNIAETSVTVPGVAFVVDSGLVKVRQFNPSLGLESLLTQAVSKSSARQRAGRAGRMGPGTCYRLYTEDDFLRLREENVPEINRVDLSAVVLMLKARGQDDIFAFDFLDPPAKEGILRALEQLFALEALSNEGEVTGVGHLVALFPLSPVLARILIAGAHLKCLNDIINIVSCLSSTSSESVFVARRASAGDEDDESNPLTRFAAVEGDHITLLKVWREYQQVKQANPTLVAEWCKQWHVSRRALRAAEDVRSQLASYCNRQGFATDDEEATNTMGYDNILKAFLTGYVLNVAFLQPNGQYRKAHGNQVVGIHPSSVLMGKKFEAIMFHELVQTTRPYVRAVSAIQINWCEKLSFFIPPSS